MFFKKTKKDKVTPIYSPLNGEVIPLENISDPVFSQKMMGNGMGFIPHNGNVVSPTKGTVTQVFPTQHAIGITTKEGLELLIHLGIDTVQLKGEGFNISVEIGDELNVKDPIGTFNLSYIEKNGKETTSVLVFPNLEQKQYEMTNLTTGEVGVGQNIVELRLK